jgi:hypothetical protein
MWLAICQGASIHINENFNKLEKKIFIKEKPDVLRQRNDSLKFELTYITKRACYVVPDFYFHVTLSSLFSLK